VLAQDAAPPHQRLAAAAKGVLTVLSEDGDAATLCAALRTFAAAGALPGLAPGALASAAHLVLSKTILKRAPRLRHEPQCAPVMLEVAAVYQRFAAVIRQSTPPALLAKVLQVRPPPSPSPPLQRHLHPICPQRSTCRPAPCSLLLPRGLALQRVRAPHRP
jgi:hypothetical protein